MFVISRINSDGNTVYVGKLSNGVKIIWTPSINAAKTFNSRDAAKQSGLFLPLTVGGSEVQELK